jgi:hypothetical protein
VGSIPDVGSLDFSVNLILPTAYDPGVDSASNRNKYQELGGKGWSARKADNLTAICEPIMGLQSLLQN